MAPDHGTNHCTAGNMTMDVVASTMKRIKRMKNMDGYYLHVLYGKPTKEKNMKQKTKKELLEEIGKLNTTIEMESLRLDAFNQMNARYEQQKGKLKALEDMNDRLSGELSTFQLVEARSDIKYQVCSNKTSTRKIFKEFTDLDNAKFFRDHLRAIKGKDSYIAKISALRVVG